MEIHHLPNSSLEVVFKVQETCNINCSYCYMYNLGNEAFKIVPQQQATDNVWQGVAKFIVFENKIRDPEYCRIVFHGGEPLLLKPKIFDRRIAELYAFLEINLSERQIQRLEFSLQTNATLVTNDWKNVLKKWKISTGVSLDGPKEIHDQRRKDKVGSGTYEKVMIGLDLLKQDKEISENGLGILCVINPEADGASVYRHLVDEVGMNGFNFLLPFMNWDNYDANDVAGISKFLVSAFKEWCKDIQNGKIRNVRIFFEAIQSLKMLDRADFVDRINVGHDVVVVECDGTIMTEESLRPTFKGLFSDLKVGTCSVSDIRLSPQFAQVAEDTYTIAEECRDCFLLNSCRSGASLGRVGMRYCSTSENVSKSVYCAAFIELYVEVFAFLSLNDRNIKISDRRLETLG